MGQPEVIRLRIRSNQDGPGRRAIRLVTRSRRFGAGQPFGRRWVGVGVGFPGAARAADSADQGLSLKKLGTGIRAVVNFW
jgi:hypothetical protein